MKTKSLQVSMLLFCTLTVLSCRKEKMGGTTNTDLLTQRSWHYHSFGIDENFDGQIDISQAFQDCAKDDIIRFATNGNGTLDQNFNFCDPDFPKMQPFTWEFLENETKLEYGGTVHTILSLNEAQLSIYTEVDNGGEVIRYILNYKH